MYLNQLLDIKESLEYASYVTKNNPYLTKLEKEDKLKEIYRKLQLINNKIKHTRNTTRHSYGNAHDEEVIKLYKRTVKHEFLTQISQGYNVSDILTYIEENISNPGVNLDKIINGLRQRNKVDGHFMYINPEDENTKAKLTSRGRRYLNNEANVRLKR